MFFFFGLEMFWKLQIIFYTWVFLDFWEKGHCSWFFETWGRGTQSCCPLLCPSGVRVPASCWSKVVRACAPLSTFSQRLPLTEVPFRIYSNKLLDNSLRLSWFKILFDFLFHSFLSDGNVEPTFPSPPKPVLPAPSLSSPPPPLSTPPPDHPANPPSVSSPPPAPSSPQTSISTAPSPPLSPLEPQHDVAYFRWHRSLLFLIEQS